MGEKGAHAPKDRQKTGDELELLGGAYRTCVDSIVLEQVPLTRIAQLQHIIHKREVTTKKKPEISYRAIKAVNASSPHRNGILVKSTRGP